jgi:hypothetical protein
LQAVFLDAQGREAAVPSFASGVSPFAPAVLKETVPVPRDARWVVLRLWGLDGKLLGELARAEIRGR